MARKKPRTVNYRRKREGKTNYLKRIRLLLAGKPRFTVRVTNKKIIVQLISFKKQGDLVLMGLDSQRLKKYGWLFSQKNLPAAYLTGFLAGKEALAKGVNEAVLDIGFKPPIRGNKIYACLKGALDAGLKISHSPEIFPSEERITGKHIPERAAQMNAVFQEVKQKIKQGI